MLLRGEQDSPQDTSRRYSFGLDPRVSLNFKVIQQILQQCRRFNNWTFPYERGT